MSLLVRDWREGDWADFEPVLREVAREGETYCLNAHCTEEEARAFWLPGSHVVVAVEDGRLLGSAKMGSNRPAQGSHVGTASFMVAADARGRGVGRLLAEHAVAWHREQGFAAIAFNAVVESNLGAVRLWRSLGFEILGTVPEAFTRPDGSRTGLHVMHLALDGGSRGA